MVLAVGRCTVDAPPLCEGSAREYRKPIPLRMATASSRRGRPNVFSDEALTQATSFSYARHVGTRRGAQDLVYRMFAVAAIEHYCEAFPEKRNALAWYFHPRRRHTLLTELGRMAGLRSTPTGSLEWDERGVVRLVEAALELAETQPSTKDGVRMLRAARALR